MMINNSLATLHCSPLTLVGEGQGERVFSVLVEDIGLPGVARRLVTFFVLPKKVTKKSRPQSTTSARFPALRGWSGFLTNSHDPLRVHVSNMLVRIP